MRAAVCNRFWETAGGGETYAFAIASALAERHDVDLVTPPGVDFSALGARLHVDVDRFGTREVDFGDPRDLMTAGADYDLFVNTSYATSQPSPARHGLLVVHFPFRMDADLPPVRRRLFRMALRADWLHRSPLEWGTGFHPREGGWPGFRWTSGDAELLVALEPGRRTTVELVVGGERPTPAEVELLVDGAAVARATTAPDADVRVRADVVGRDDGEPVVLRLRSDTFSPAEALGIDDDRRLGVQVRAAWVGRDVGRKLAHGLPLLQRTESLRWLDSYDRVLVNSDYTRGWVRRWWGRGAEVLHPAVAPRGAGEKGPLILSVGRFFAPERGHSKKQLEMVVAFRRLVERGVTGWELHLVGGCQAEDRPYLDRVRAMAHGLPVVVHVDAPGPVLDDLYRRASVYWHATGVLEDPLAVPERQEHFGIAVAEAMSAGAVPVVFGAAGPAEIVRHGEEGYHFHSLEELVDRTASLVADEGERARLMAGSLAGAERFTQEALSRRLHDVVDSVLDQEGSTNRRSRR